VSSAGLTASGEILEPFLLLGLPAIPHL